MCTSAFVADRVIRHIATLGDGNGDLRFDPDGPGGARQHDGIETVGASPDCVHRRAVAAGRGRLQVVGRRDA
jgi:hypothetical protein